MLEQNELPLVYFAVRDFDIPVLSLTVMMGIEPDVAWEKGEHFSDDFPEAERVDSRWIIGSGVADDASYFEHFESLLLKLEAAPQIQQIIDKYSAGVAVSRFYFHEHADFFLPDEISQRYAKLGLKISFDQLGFDRND